MNKEEIVSRKKDIEILLEKAERLFSKIEIEYKKALETKKILPDMQIDIKDFFGNLRSALDYLAHDIVEKFCQNANPKDNIYFPIRTEEKAFEKVMKKTYPKLQENCEAVYNILKSVQPFEKPENIWFRYFNEINNENKHERLVPQIRTEKRGRVTVKPKTGGVITWDSQTVKFGKNVYAGGVPIDTDTQLPIPSDSQTVLVEVWADLQFESISVSSMELMQKSISNIRKICNEILVFCQKQIST